MNTKKVVVSVLIISCALPLQARVNREDKASSKTSKAHSASVKEKRASVKEISSKNEFDNVIKQNKLVIADFYSPTCPHCRNMEPIFNQLAAENKDITFIKINTTKLSPLSREYKVRSMPTFIFFKNGANISSSVGEAKKAEFQQEIDKIYKESL